MDRRSHAFRAVAPRLLLLLLPFLLLPVMAQVHQPIRVTNTNLPRIYAANLVYSGAFRVPQNRSGGSGQEYSLIYGAAAIAFDSSTPGIYITCAADSSIGVQAWNVAEINIPTLVNSATVTDLHTAAFVQPCTNIITPNTMYTLNDPPGTAGTFYQGGLLPRADGKLLYSGFLYYDTGVQTTTHFVTSQNFAAIGTVTGPWTLGTTIAGFKSAGFVNQAMTPIPSVWQSTLGGDALASHCCYPTIGITSSGPNANAFTAADVGVTDPVPIIQLLNYPLTHPTIGAWSSTGQMWNTTACGTNQAMALTDQSRSLLYFCQRGEGAFCYGAGTNDPALHLKPVPQYPTQHYCYDPVYPNTEGTHAEYYDFVIYAFDVLDLARVKAGAINPWDVWPYAIWNFTTPFGMPSAANGGTHPTAAIYDPTTHRIYVAISGQDAGGTAPVIHAWTLTGL